MPRLPTAFRSQPKTLEADWQSRRTAYRHWYALPVWRAVRASVLRRDAYICQACGQAAGKSAHCDHIKPHRGDWDLFLDDSNLHTLCASCHAAKTASEDGGFGNV
jgi:5-methylcytosine-specific restriction protein A